MITKIKIDGFKSLNSFELNIKPGINILVGPNGSGKTNIILFFEFLSNLVSEDLHNAVTKAGGAGTIFRKLGESEYSNSIKCYVEGCRVIGNEGYMKYSYFFSIGTSFDKDFLFFEEQNLKAKIVPYFTTKSDFSKWDIEFIQDKYLGSNKPKLNLTTLNIENFKPRFIYDKNEEKDIISSAQKYINDFNVLNMSIIQSIFPFGESSYIIYQDFKGGGNI